MQRQSTKGSDNGRLCKHSLPTVDEETEQRPAAVFNALSLQKQ